MKRRTHSPAFAAVIVCGGTALAQAPAGDQDKLDLSQIIGAMGGMSMGAPRAEGAFPDFNEVTKDMTATKGLFTLWSYPAGAKDKDPERLLCQIPAGFLGEKFMLSTSISGGGFFTGFPLDERVVQWEILGRQLLLVEPETRFVVNKSKTVADVVQRTYPERIRRAVPIVTKSPAGDPVIDLGEMLKSDFADVTWMSFFDQGMPGLGVNPALSKWSKKKAFELNVEIGVELAVARMHPPGAFDKKIVHFSFWRLPASDYRPRIADDRVGYFLTSNLDWSKPVDARELFNRYIDRWPLVKRDPELALCEPRQPIIFYIEKTVPVRYRRAVGDGILEWNKAFEQIGYSSAVVVRQQTDDNEWKDLDPEDMRYSFFRWIVTGAGFAMGPHRGNPFTGEIYDADILFDDSMVRYFEMEAERLLPSTAMRARSFDPALGVFLEQHPQWSRPERPWERFNFTDPQEQKLRDAMRSRMYQQGRHLCDYADGMKHQMMLAHAFLATAQPDIKEQYLYDVIKEVVMHEVGHTLGLRHNFKASSVWSVEEIVSRREAGQPTTGSVMDYNPVLFFADGSTRGNFLTPTIGPYDHWAIEYGYRPFDGSYKAPKKDDASPPAAEPEAKPAPAEPEAAAAAQPAPMGLPEGFNIESIPPEILAQIPPHILQMIQSGQWQQLMASAPGAPPAAAAAAPAKQDGPSFSAPVSGEDAMLREIASRSTAPELAYGTDEDATLLGTDPRTRRFDVGDDPIAWARDRTTLVNERKAKLQEWAVKDQEAWYFLTDAFLSLMIEKAFVLDYVGGYIGGQYFSRAHKGEPGAEPPFVLVDPRTQREALSFIEASLYNDEFFAVPPEVLNHLAPSRWWHEGSSISFTMDFQIHELISVLQWWNLFERLFPNTLRRIHDAELKTDSAERLTAAEYIQRIKGACWGPTIDPGGSRKAAWTDANPMISDTRRSLQREYLGLVEPLVRTRPGYVLSPDLHAMVTQSVRDLSQEIDQVLGSGKIDFASEAHLNECKSRIKRMLEAELPEYQR